ncbi:hypothetical protein HELRODRAFT_188490 [Helobdella robusta]|uniref:BACK domain-containing protein n=1 Tax=Helobdella robusta TaxID=6412 RepID=T1FQ18_HELRO|nr:hypothetical protein HELRODRAFT_188490 [Helobdella robusta]ESO01825.1 hypothetical protein HELRODRAFT_188490 [Helobdella robusta]
MEKDDTVEESPTIVLISNEGGRYEVDKDLLLQNSEYFQALVNSGMIDARFKERGDMLRLVESDLVNVGSEFDIFDLVVKWASVEESRRQDAELLFSKVRYKLMTENKKKKTCEVLNDLKINVQTECDGFRSVGTIFAFGMPHSQHVILTLTRGSNFNTGMYYVVRFQINSNDLTTETPELVAARYESLLRLLENKIRPRRIIILSLVYRKDLQKWKVDKLNVSLKQFQSTIVHFWKLCRVGGDNNIGPDGIHLNERGMMNFKRNIIYSLKCTK